MYVSKMAVIAKEYRRNAEIAVRHRWWRRYLRSFI